MIGVILKFVLLVFAFSVFVNVLAGVVDLLPHFATAFAACCGLGAVWGAFNSQGKPLLHGLIAGGLWLPKKVLEIGVALAKFAARFVMGLA